MSLSKLRIGTRYLGRGRLLVQPSTFGRRSVTRVSLSHQKVVKTFLSLQILANSMWTPHHPVTRCQLDLHI